MELDSAFSYCAGEVRRLDRDRFLCALFAPADARRGLMALYAFNLELARIPETVSEPLLGHMRLQWWRDALTAHYGGKPVPNHQTAVALARTITRHGLDHAAFKRMLDGRAFDLDDRPFADLAAFEAYAEATSATLAGLALDVLGQDGRGVRQAAKHVGMAWALSGHLRAAQHHALAGRLYLPWALMEGAGIGADALVAKTASPAPAQIARIAQVARPIAERAWDHLQRAREAGRDAPRAALPALLPATLAAADLRRLARLGYDLTSPKLEANRAARQLRLYWHALSWYAPRGRF
ncbi:MAG: squalene/phytoene synthase family protein [Alphaproteobacteria bacterium]